MSIDQKTNSTLPAAQSLRDALAASAPLARLQALMRESAARLDTIRPLLAPDLAAQAGGGPIDAEGWTLLAASPAAAAKLRQLRPRLEASLAQAGWQGSVIRIRVQRR